LITVFGVACSFDNNSIKPNFIIIFTDDQGYQDVGCFGSPNIKTPNLDKMAAEGMRLTSFYAQTVCGPSRAALMTGYYPMRNACSLGNEPYFTPNELIPVEENKN
jgi:arylsulfatase A-like enzyme